MGKRKIKVRTPERKSAFLASLSAGSTAADAASEAGICRQSAYEWRAADADFRAEWNLAYAAGADALEAAAQRRAVQGVERPVLYQGRPVFAADGTPLLIREYSDTLLIFLLKSRSPERYCDRARTAKLLRKWEKADAAGDKSADINPELAGMLDAAAANKAALAETA